MGRQQALDFRGERLAAVWMRLPPQCRKEVIALWMQVIARAAQEKSKRKGVTK
jgi:hypothetical protein